MPSSCRIAIVGGGLAGLAAAHALKTFGMKAQVFETAPALGEIGAAVNVSPQAVKALRAIGVGDKLAAIGTASPGIQTRNMQTGEFLEFNDRHKTGARLGALEEGVREGAVGDDDDGEDRERRAANRPQSAPPRPCALR